MKKQLFSLSAALIAAASATAQTGTGIGTITPNSSAILDVSATNKGVLLPRVTLQSVTDALTISAPATGLVVYNTNTALAAGVGLYYNAGTPVNPLWSRMAAVSAASAPATGQTIIWNGTTYVTGNPAIAVASGTPLSGNGTGTTPLTINVNSPVYNAGSIQGKTVSATAPANGQVLVYNATTNQYVPSAAPGDNWGTQTPVTSGPAISGNGTAASPLIVNNTSPIFNANQLNNTSITGTPINGQSLVFNGTSYAPGNPGITTGGTSFTGNGTPGSPLIFNGIVSNAPLSGAGTTASPLTINTASPVYNANSIQGKAVSTTAPNANEVLVWNGTNYTPSVVNAAQIQGQPVSTTVPTTNQVLVWNGTSYTPGAVNAAQIQGKSVSTTGPSNGQALVWNSTTNQYVPVTVASSASNGLNLSGNDVRLGGALTQATTITTSASKTLSISGTSNTTTFDAAGNIGIGTTNPTSALTISGANALRLQGLQNGYGNVLVVDGTGIVKQIPASATTFNYSACNTSGVHISCTQLTGPVPYTQNSAPNGTIPGGGSWTMIPGLSKTITIANPNNTVYFNTEGVAQYDGTMSTNGVTSYSIGIFIDGQLQATRSYTMIGSGSAGQFDTYNIAGQIDDLPSGNHTFQVYVTRRMQNSASNDLYFDGPSTVGNTNSFMTRGVLFISGTY